MTGSSESFGSQRNIYDQSSEELPGTVGNKDVGATNKDACEEYLGNKNNSNDD